MKRATRLNATWIALLASLTMAGGQTAAPAPDAPPSPALPANPTPALAAPTATSTPSPTMDIINSAKLTDTRGSDGVSPAIVRTEVMLDRVHASPGVIDGRDGENFVHAIEIYEKAKGLRATKGLGDKVWSSLLAESGGPVLMEYVLTDQDVEGPFFPNLPKDYGELAKLKAMGYRNPSQKISAMFHMGEDLLATLNPGVDLSKAGTKILVAEGKRQPIHGTLKTIVVDKKKSQVLGYDRESPILVASPPTIGSRELPSPSGSYKGKGVAYNPIYYYDPDNFVQGHNKEMLRLPPATNNPVGSVFIALTKPTYGLHGTPDPSKIDKNASHGCVRMTNWDASELAHLVKRGIVVAFKS